ncbi:MAG: hypothetical protein ABFD52_06390 [Acidobacteriota bacterium]
MDFCKIVDRLYAALPLRPLRDGLIRAHMDRCPRCQARLLGREEARRLLVGPGQVGDQAGLWQRISRQAAAAVPAPASKPRGGEMAWGRALAVATAAVVALAGFWLLRQADRPDLAAEAAATAGRFRIDYVNVGGAPARTFVYQPQGSDTVFVWASRTP